MKKPYRVFHCWFFHSRMINKKINLKLVIIMKNWPNDLRLRCVTSSRVEWLEEYLDVYNSLFEKNEELITNFCLFKEDWFYCWKVSRKWLMCSSFYFVHVMQLCHWGVILQPILEQFLLCMFSLVFNFPWHLDFINFCFYVFLVLKVLSV